MEWVRIGKVGKSHGVKGAFSVQEHSGEESALGYVRQVWVGGFEYAVEEASFSASHGWRLKLAGWDNPETVKERLHREIAIPREHLRRAGEGEFYLADIVGFTVREEGTGRDLGKFVGVDSTPGPDRWWFERDGRRWAAPATSDFILRVDTDKREIWVKDVEALL